MLNLKPKIGVYICHCGMNIAPQINVKEVAHQAMHKEHVVIAREYKFMCSGPGQDLIIADIKNLKLNRVVVASCSPRMHELTFRKTCQNAGLNPYYFQMANIREQSSWVTLDSGAATAKAHDLVSAAVARVAFHRSLQTREVSVTKAILIVGAGIAGIQAALTVAAQGLQVYLLERESAIGGQMAKFDKTFPTLDCAACIMTPKTVSAAQHENIKLLTYSELIDLQGSTGNYKARILNKPRYVDADKCVGCGVCMEKCPTKKIPSEFDQGLCQRPAIYIPFPQAIPRIPIIDVHNCRKLGQNKPCGVCAKFCETDAIDFDQKPSYMDIDIGAVILATGFKTFDPTPLVQYGYGIFPEVYTSLEFERLNNATGPTSGKILMKNGRSPEKVAIIHCVGSRDQHHHKYCSRVCCMYSMKFAHLIREKSGAEVWEYYIDIRAPGKLYEEFYHRVQEEGVHFIRGRVAEVTDIPDQPADHNRLTVVAENTLTRRVLRTAVDMVILSTGLEPACGSEQLSRLVGVSGDGDSWFNELHAKLAPVSTPVQGIFLAGCCQGPKDIPDTVAQAMGAAGEATALLAKGTVVTMAETASIDPQICAGCQTCIQVCSYSAIRFDHAKKIARINEAVCQGCGSCAAACPSSASMVKHFTDRQIMEEVEALLN